jgi:hypothetical protein
VRGHEHEDRRVVPLRRRAGVALPAFHAVDVRLEGQEVAHGDRVDRRQQHELAGVDPVGLGGHVGRRLADVGLGGEQLDQVGAAGERVDPPAVADPDDKTEMAYAGWLLPPAICGQLHPGQPIVS